MTVTSRVRQVIKDEATALLALIDRVGPEYDEAVNLILSTGGKVIVTGMGKAGHIGKKIAASLASTGTPAFFVHPGEAVHGDSGMVRNNDVVIALSNSGETGELLACLNIVQKIGAPIIAITGGAQSSLASMAKITLDCAVQREVDPHNLAPTASAIAQLAIGDALTVALMVERGFTPEDFALFHPGGALGKRLLSNESTDDSVSAS